MGKFYITTAIPYASGKSHIGNVYEDVLADAIEAEEIMFQEDLDYA